MREIYITNTYQELIGIEAATQIDLKTGANMRHQHFRGAPTLTMVSMEREGFNVLFCFFLFQAVVQKLF